MNKSVLKLLSVIILFALLSACTITASCVTEDEINKKITSTSEYMLTLDTPTVSSIGGEWLVTGLARNNTINNSFADGYYNNVVEYVSNIGSSKLHRAQSTDNSRVIIALTSIGKDVTDVAGYNLLEPLADFNYVVNQGINGPIWALIALDTILYEIPQNSSASATTTRDKLIEYIISKELENGGWSLSGSNADPDITAMAIQSLAPYYNKNSNVNFAVNRALYVLLEIQLDNGGFSSWNTDNSESTAQVLTALSALKIKTDDVRFVKNNNSPADVLMDFATDNGFKHIKNSSYNQMATEQAFYALVACKRLSESKTSLYDMTDLLLAMDVNEDKKVSIDDATFIQKYIADMQNFTLRQTKIADCNNDEAVSVDDATLLQKTIVEIN